MTRAEKSVNIRAGQERAKANGKHWGYPLKGDKKEREQIACAVALGELTLRRGAALLNIHPATLRDWMTRHGFEIQEKCVEPTERDLKALREYWCRDCTQQDVIEFTGRSYNIVHGWILNGYGKENNNA